MITYIAINKTNGKFYIGSTKNIKRRKSEHLRTTENLPFQNALRKNPDMFDWEIYEDSSDEPILEQALLDIWYGKEQCYNINPNASRPPSAFGRKVKDETKKKISTKMIGREINQKTRDSVSISNKTRKLSKDTLDKKSKVVSGVKNPFYGKKHSETTIKEFKEKRKGLKWWHNPITQSSSMSKECPGKEWFPGRKPKHQQPQQNDT